MVSYIIMYREVPKVLHGIAEKLKFKNQGFLNFNFDGT
jgi:hypothetical protein